MAIDPTQWPMRDIKELERRLGKTTNDLFVKGYRPNAEELVVLYWLHRKQTEPDYTYEDAEGVSYATIGEAMRPDPTSAGTPDTADGSRPSRTSTATRRRISGV